MCAHRLMRSLIVAIVILGVLLGNADAKRRRKRPAPVEQTVTDPTPTETAAPAADPDPPAARPDSAAGGGDRGTRGSTAASSGAPGSADKAGRFMANFRIGPAFGAYNAAHMGAIVLEFGVALLGNNNGYLIVPLQFQFREGGGAVVLPVGFQYDFALPIKGLYLYPRLSLGYAALIASGAPTTHVGVLIPEFGAKYVMLKGRLNVGGEIFSLPIAFNGDGASLFYRIMLMAGVNF